MGEGRGGGTGLGIDHPGLCRTVTSPGSQSGASGGVGGGTATPQL